MFTQFEVLSDVIKTTHNKNITLKDVEKKLRKYQVKNFDQISKEVKAIILQDFKLEETSKSDLKKQVKSLIKENSDLRSEIIEKLNTLIEQQSQIISKLDKSTDTSELEEDSDHDSNLTPLDYLLHKDDTPDDF